MRWFKYEPAAPCRPDVYGEGIFVEHWQLAMREPLEYGDGEENETFASIVSPWDPIARDAIAASSLICWLGTNCGRCFLEQAAKLKAKLDPEDAYSLEWARQNRRMPGWNNHQRTIDVILPAEMIDVRSSEVIEIVVRWLGTARGQRMIRDAEAEIDLTCKEIREQNMAKARARARAADVIERREAFAKMSWEAVTWANKNRLKREKIIRGAP